MATFRPVNTALSPESHARSGEETTPTTPRPSTAPDIQPAPMHRDDATTPTRANFGGALASQRPLPVSPFPAAISVPENTDSVKQELHRGDSQHSTKSKESEDVEMGDSDDGEDGSDDESLNADGTKSNKKKKSQRFYCTEYPPCNLSFTRSEHLARHIRKHTGERPFQCHCSRRFSRLDNLRQHAQTVHLNEEIPQDSLAATGTRFQRQVRTERVRPPGSRSRAGTTGSQTGQGRGHHRNSLSASSIQSMSSVSSAYSQREDIRRRPPPLVMAGEPRARYSQEIYRPESPSSQYQYRPHSPTNFSTPTSATFSTGNNSPRWTSGMQSPISSHSRTASLYAGHRTPGRRLSVPSTNNPFQSPHGQSFSTNPLTPLNSSNMGAYSPSSSMMASPTTSTSGSIFSGRREPLSAADDYRRRTWHPDVTSSGYTSSRLQVVTTPNYYSNGPPPQPASVVPSNAPPLPPLRLPGISSFDPVPRPTTPVRRQPSPMMIDTPSRAPPQATQQNHEERPNSQQWDMGINRNFNRLDITQGTPPTDAASSWASEANKAVQAQAEQARAQPLVRFEESPYSARAQANGSWHQHTISAPPITPKEAKRQAWYHGPVPPQNAVPAQRTSPADSSGSEGAVPGTPSSSNAGEIDPSIVHANGWVENRNGNGVLPAPQDPRMVSSHGYASYHPQNSVEGAYTYASGVHQGQAPQHQIPKSTDSNMLRLEALVAVATSEENVAATGY